MPSGPGLGQSRRGAEAPRDRDHSSPAKPRSRSARSLLTFMGTAFTLGCSMAWPGSTNEGPSAKSSPDPAQAADLRAAATRHAVVHRRPRVSLRTPKLGRAARHPGCLSQVLDGVYAHLPLKRSLYGFDVIRGHRVPAQAAAHPERSPVPSRADAAHQPVARCPHAIQGAVAVHERWQACRSWSRPMVQDAASIRRLQSQPAGRPGPALPPGSRSTIGTAFRSIAQSISTRKARPADAPTRGAPVRSNR